MRRKLITLLKHATYIFLFACVFIIITVLSLFRITNHNSAIHTSVIVILAVLIMLALGIFINKLILNDSFKKSAVYSLILIVIYIAMTFGTYYSITSYINNFSSAKWERFTSARYHMIDDLMSRYEFMGMTKEEVIDILGEPDTPYSPADVEVLDYFVGAWVIDPVVLTFEFEDGKVAEIYTYVEYRENIENVY